jgi:hypothetical protein
VRWLKHHPLVKRAPGTEIYRGYTGLQKQGKQKREVVASLNALNRFEPI